MNLNRTQIAERSSHALGLLQPSAFRSWLLAFEEGQVVGDPKSIKTCPLANYLRAQMGGRPLVLPDSIRVASDVWAEMPRWAVVFIAAVDRRPRKPISCELALTILDTVLAQSPTGEAA